MYFVQGHYRQPLAFSEEALHAARRSVDRLRELCRRLDREAGPPPGIEPYAERFWDALADDFNTARARAVLFEWVTEANRRLDAGERLGIGALEDMLWAIGFERLVDEAGGSPEVGGAAGGDGPPPEVEALLAEREAARAARDWTTADAKRDALTALGWEVRDTPDGPRLVSAS